MLDCERLISAYNRLKSLDRLDFREKLLVFSDYLYINVLKWFSDKSRWRTEPSKAANQSWFETVFDDDDFSLCESSGSSGSIEINNHSSTKRS